MKGIKMNKEDVKEIQESIDIKLTETIARSVVQEMSKQEINKSNAKIFKIICIVFSITMLISVLFTSYVGIKLLNFMDNIVIEEESEDISFDTNTGDSSNGDAINIYNNGNNNTNTKGGD